ncbi:protocatechuate 3,4-dioxygenase subunit alpha [Nocardioides pocheonensis]|uniref:Protocatechuate 3,4-dioxygenase subunit alpha n=1 Tax=Nocardioides pocheonensis TaxID=661485 RepID=A0A3N0GY01_9ACTN|nr:protocatechuate 3,4-dioxygenase subunit alpha [Nocardioides pocheonensis]RNM17020.1 protocatechuate 3,4-dioxygenase subunit alpha [Nocardioides pocheonensis]
MTQSPTLPPTPGQTVGPFYGFALPYAGGNELVPPGRPDAIRLRGTVRDGRGDPVPDALIEVWQADEQGRISREPGSLQRDGFTFTGWGRTSVDRTGEYSFTTVVPGPTEGAAPFFAITVFARGLLNRLFTRAYVPDHPLLESDRLLASVPADRRGSLVARRDATGLVFDIRLQGEGETVFLSYPGHDG